MTTTSKKLTNGKSSLDSIRLDTTTFHKRTASTDTTAKFSNKTVSSNYSQINYKRLDNLYQNGINKKKRFEMMDKLKREEQSRKEFEACTFKPQLNKAYKPSKQTVMSEIPIYERQAIWHNQKIDKIEQKIKTNKNNEEKFSFTPVISKKPNFVEAYTPYDRQTKSYLDRLKTAQKLKEEIRDKQTVKCKAILIFLGENFNKKLIQRNNIKEQTMNTYINEDRVSIIHNIGLLYF
jgi:hypothetical protein